MILAVRAAELASEGKKVLVVTYNITLIHYLRLICYSYRKGLDNRRIEWRHFHFVCRNIICLIRGSEEYAKIIQGIPDEGDDDISKENKEKNRILRDSILQIELPETAKRIL